MVDPRRHAKRRGYRIAAGKSNSEIAALLVLSVRTVERHTSNIYSKIGAGSAVARATATAYALQHGLDGGSSR